MIIHTITYSVIARYALPASMWHDRADSRAVSFEAIVRRRVVVVPSAHAAHAALCQTHYRPKAHHVYITTYHHVGIFFFNNLAATSHNERPTGRHKALGYNTTRIRLPVNIIVLPHALACVIYAYALHLDPCAYRTRLLSNLMRVNSAIVFHGVRAHIPYWFHIGERKCRGALLDYVCYDRCA